MTTAATIEKVTVRVFRTVAKTGSDVEGHRHPSPARQVEQGLVSVTDTDGVTGHCLVQGNHLDQRVLDNHIKPVLLGQDAHDRERLWRLLTRRQRGGGGAISDRGLGYVDQALWDLAGRKLGLPVWKLLGGARAEVPAYASTMCGDEIVGGLSSPEDYGAFASQLVDAGYRAIKLHTWMPPVSFAPDVTMDSRACAAVREAVGPDIDLMLDANHWYTRIEALRLGRALQELDYYWYEEPMEEASVDSYRWLREQLSIPVIGPETAWGKHFARAEWVKAGACDILRAGVNDVGGITPTLKIVHLAESFNMDCEIHGGGSGNLAILGGTYAGRWYERGLLHPHFDYDELPPHLNSIVDAVDKNGVIAMPTRPGLGDDLDLDYIDANTVTTW